MCGEQLGHLLPGGSLWGSPPRVRGTAISLHTCRIGQRITPACAGNSQALNTLSPLLEDHPRVCEEQRIHSPAVAVLVGSPPRVRGTVFFWGRLAHGGRITPACAGNSRPWRFG